MYQIEKVSKLYKKKEEVIYAVNEVSFEVKQGTIFGLIGLSGAGKSTLLRCLNLLEIPDKGKVYFQNQDLTSMPSKSLRKHRQNIGMIFQHFNLFPSRTVFENVALPLKLQGLAEDEIKTKVSSVLKYVSLENRINAYPKTLSGGEAQRVAIARAIVSEPKVLLCDEPTSALDPQTTGTILQLLKDLNQKLDLTIVLITHELEVVESICDEVAVLKKGCIVDQGPVEEVFMKMQSDETKRLLQIPLRVKKAKEKITDDEKLILVNERYADFTSRSNLDNVLDLAYKNYHGEAYVSYIVKANKKDKLEEYDGPILYKEEIL